MTDEQKVALTALFVVCAVLAAGLVGVFIGILAAIVTDIAEAFLTVILMS